MTSGSTPHSYKSIAYRPDIDGLRAVAVLSVLAYHAGFAFFEGGFAGVDVFFVISGYLIARIIARDLANGSFSVLAFYERRIRRIFPAMFAMLLAVSICAWYLLYPSVLIAFERSLLAALFSGSNILFWHETGYFDSQRFSKPLLHTWSLAVEEQFYLLFPPFLLLLWRTSIRPRKVVIFAITALSFAAAMFFALTNPSAAFFLTPFRAWELLLGAILSQHSLPPLRSALQRQIASITGLSLILVTVFCYRESMLFPGLATLPACVGAALVIAAGESGSSIVGQALSWKPVVFTGLISYSLYLWHWPVMAFQNTNWLFVPYAYRNWHITKIVTILISLVLAVLSWAFLERPFRERKISRSRQSIFITAGTGITMLSVAAICLIAFHGAPKRFPPDELQIASYLDESIRVPWRMDVCFISPTNSFSDFRPDICLAQHPGKKSLLLIGDSHAASLYPGLVNVFPDYDIMQANFAGCFALLHEPPSQPRGCRKLFDFIFGDFLTHHHVDALILAGRWSPADFHALGETVAWAQRQGIQVILVGRTLEFDAPLPRLLASSRHQGASSDFAMPSSIHEQADEDQVLADLSRNQWHVPYVSFFESLCHPDCPVYAAPLVPMTFDSQHLTLEGSKLFAGAIRDKIESLGQTSR